MQSRKIQYRRHLEDKERTVRRVLEEIDCSSWLGIIPSPISGGFRNRAKFRIFPGENGTVISGTDPIGGNVPFELSLWCLPEWGRGVVKNAAAFINDQRRDYHVDGFEIQCTHGQPRAHIGLSVRKDRPLPYGAFARKMMEEVPGLTGVAVPSQRLEAGEVFLEHLVKNQKFYAHYRAFFQSNLHLTEELVNKVVFEAANIPFDAVFDLYSGVGLMGLSAAGCGTPVTGIESDRKAVESARMNARLLGSESARFLCMRAEKATAGLCIRHESLVIINPPRSGIPDAVVRAAAEKKPVFLILVSCFLETHARDLRLWRGKGYAVRSFHALDMFPFTRFLETVTLMELAA